MKSGTTPVHVEFATYFVNNCYIPLKVNQDIRKRARNIYDDYANRRQGLLGIRNALISICGECNFDDDVLATFRPAIKKHLDGIPVRRETLSATDRQMLMEKFGLICPICGRPIVKGNIDHILPFFIVFDTFETANLQFLCEDCNRAKNSRLMARICA